MTSSGLNWKGTAPVTVSPGSRVPETSPGVTDVWRPSLPPPQPSFSDMRVSQVWA